jgi:hypothetical protein
MSMEEVHGQFLYLTILLFGISVYKSFLLMFKYILLDNFYLNRVKFSNIFKSPLSATAAFRAA